MASFVAPTLPISSELPKDLDDHQHQLLPIKPMDQSTSPCSSSSSCENHDGTSDLDEENALEEELRDPRPLAIEASRMSSSSCSSSSSAAHCVTIPHLSFATDLLLNHDQVETSCSRGLCTQQSLVTLLKARIQLEQLYAKEMKKIANASHLEELEQENSSLRNALGQMRAQYLNTSVQHEILAKNLLEDVLRPIESLYEINRQKANNLHKLLSNIKKQAKMHEEAYRKEQAHFEKMFKEASNAFNAAMDNGFSSSAIEQQYHSLLDASRLQDFNRFCSTSSLQPQTNAIDEANPDGEAAMAQQQCLRVSDSATKRASTSSVSSPPENSSFNYSMMKNRRSLNLSKSNNGKKLVNWLLPSDSSRKESICSNAVNSLETAEQARVNCRMIWRAVETSRIEMYRAIQSVLTEYQQIAEHRISNLTTNLRKHVIFESSLLANEQYDWQMIARNIEEVDFEGDIREFILTNHRPLRPTMTVHDLCRIDPHHTGATSASSSNLAQPPKASPLEIRDVALRKIPVDGVGNQERLCELLVTRLQQDSSPPSRRSSLLQPRDDDEHTEEQKEQHDAKLLRVSVAKDVARAIAKAYELRAIKKSSQGALVSSESSLSEDRESGFPDLVGGEGIHSFAHGSDLEESSCSTSSTSVPGEASSVD